MAARKKSHDARAADEAFNNPFAHELKRLRRKVRDAAAASTKRAAPERSPEVRPPRTEREEFFDAVEGASPLAKPGRRVRRHAETPNRRDHDHARLDFTADEHFDVRFSDRYIRASAAGVSSETVAKLARGEFAVRSHVDLHGMALDDARQAVDEFLADRHRSGERCVLVITGKGRNSRRQLGVLREKIPEWLARGPSARRVLAFVTARQCDGGEGALYVLLRKQAARKTRIDIVAGGGE